MSVNTREFYGSGLRFPIQIDERGRLASSHGEPRVEDSIMMILGTARGERRMLPRFGCGIHDLTFEPNTPTVRGRIAVEVRQALLDFERRIDVLSIDVNASPEQGNLLLIRIDYRLRNNNVAGNLVYPFFLNEGG
jgi:phage baseplate assembly protein W